MDFSYYKNYFNNSFAKHETLNKQNNKIFYMFSNLITDWQEIEIIIKTTSKNLLWKCISSFIKTFNMLCCFCRNVIHIHMLMSLDLKWLKSICSEKLLTHEAAVILLFQNIYIRTCGHALTHGLNKSQRVKPKK